MKKRNLLLLFFVCLLSICVFTGLLVYAFNLQIKKDLQDRTTKQETDVTSDTGTKSDVDEASAAGATLVPTQMPSAQTVSEETSENASTDNPSKENQITPTPAGDNSDNADLDTPSDTSIVLDFAGDISFSEGSKPMAKYDAENKGISGGFSKDLLTEMNSADIMMLNNEFPYSARGTKTPDKSFTFRADPSRVGILSEMGVDIVSLANNHALDYGEDALWDTFDTLEAAGIEYVGAGADLDRAIEPIYKTIGDKTIAFVAASRVVFAMDWYATDTRPGMIGTYDPTIILESIKKAKANSDFVVMFVHWGVERNSHPEEYQRTLAKQYIDAGADAVVGCHPHVMQGFEFYKGKPIAYSLGNFWFNSVTKESGLVKLTLAPDGSVQTQILPVMTKDTFTYLLEKEKDRKNYFDFIEGLSYEVTIDSDGYVTPKE